MLRIHASRALAHLPSPASAMLALLPGLALLATLAPAASATDGAVYTMTNSPQGNAVLVFLRSEATGTLTLQATVPTGGNGTGAALGNQGAIALSDDARWLLVVNPGSDTISSFGITPDGLQLVDTAGTGGHKPVSVDVDGDFVAILNAGGDVGEHDSLGVRYLNEDGTFGKLRASRKLSQAVTSPAEVKFVQEGHVIVVTEKDTARIDTFRLRPNGALSKVIVHEGIGQEPFGFTAVARDHILVTDAMLGTVTNFGVDREGELAAQGPALDTTELATCWAVATPGDRRVYTTNTMSGTVTGLHLDFDANPELLNPDGVTATVGAMPVDATVSDDGHFLYVLASGPDEIDVYHVNEDGSLTSVEVESGLPDGSNGLVAR